MILMNDFRRDSAAFKRTLIERFQEVLDSGHYILGRKVESFESAWANACGAGYCVGVANGMDALEIILRAQGIGEGDEVITTGMTAYATILAIIRAGAVPVLADINPKTALLSIESAERCLSPKTKAVLVVHLYGRLSEMEQWEAFCRKHQVQLIEDCAQAHGAHQNMRYAGAFGVAGGYSFYPTKNLGCIGDGGAIITNNSALANRAKTLRNYGQTTRYHHTELGLNSRLDELQAAFLLEKMEYLPLETRRRQQIGALYNDHIINENIKLQERPAELAAHVYHLYPVTTEYREQLQNHLHDCGIQTLIHYPVPAHQQAALPSLKKDREGLPNTEKHADQCLSIPIHPHLTDSEIDQVIECLNDFNPK
jgi:dTDP-4-amino-4,6-dideoxygalactose transaminase